tara:strand:+ start:688 stop:1797 length:1110 start_codon:yes stop_codon:yes gene_type:complete
MNICLIGDGLVSLTLAKTLVNNKIKVSMYYSGVKKTQSQNRTISISANNWDYLQNEVIKLNKKLAWEINDIEIYNEENREEKILNFNKSRKKLFLIIKNNSLYEALDKSLKKSDYFKKIKIVDKSNFSKNIFKKNFDLIINCNPKNQISKKYFYNKIIKNYESTAYAGIINHSKIQNKKAVQIFTKYGPLAFLPISKSQTSIVFSIKNKSINNRTKISEAELKKLILKNNQEYKISSVSNFENSKLKSKILRNYYHNNILAFGDMLHQIHPLAGQGFNMAIRDLKVLLNLIRERKNLGLPIDISLCETFESRTKHLNFVFASGNDFIYEFFNYDNFYIKPFSKKIFKYLNNNKLFNKLAIEYSDKGLFI